MAELADARDSKSRDRKIMRVQFPPPAQIKKLQHHAGAFVFWDKLGLDGKFGNLFIDSAIVVGLVDINFTEVKGQIRRRKSWKHLWHLAIKISC